MIFHSIVYQFFCFPPRFLFTAKWMISFCIANDSNSLKIYFLKWENFKELHYSKKFILSTEISLTFKIFIKDKQILIFSFILS